MRSNGLVISFRTESWMAKDDLSESMTTPAIQHYYKSGLKPRYRAARITLHTLTVCLNEVYWKSSMHEISRVLSLAKYISKTIKNTKQMSFISTRIRVRTACAKPQQNLTFLLSVYTWSDVYVSLYMESTNRPAEISGKCFTCLCLVSSCNSTHNVTSTVGWGWMRGQRCQQNRTPKPKWHTSHGNIIMVTLRLRNISVGECENLTATSHCLTV